MNTMEKIKRIWNYIFVPTSIEPLKCIILFENVLCIYRNIRYYKNKQRISLYLRLMIEISLTTACIIVYSIYIFPLSVITATEYIYFYVSGVNSITIILLACYSSRMFEKLLSLIESNDLYFANDEHYQSNKSKQDSFIKYGLLILISSIFTLEVIQYVRNNDIANLTVSLLSAVFFLYSNICNFRYVYEYIALYSILYVMSEQLECITRAVSKKSVSVTTTIGENDHISDDENDDIQFDIEEFGQLSSVFSNIKEYSKLYNKIYGLQLILMLGSSTAYCIMFLYTLTFLSVRGYKDVTSLVISVLKLLIFIILLLLLSFGAQTKQNNLQKLRRQLGKLLIKCVTNDAHYKATKDFLRLVSTRCVRTETLGSIDVDMSLIPSFIIFITSYTVIALQFNNIV